MDALDDNAADASRKTLGETLAAERERQGLSRADAAQRLHMSAWQVEALETGDFARLPKGTFLRGFVRNYAKVLGLAPESIMPLLVEDAPVHGRPGIVVPTQNIRFDPLHERLQNPYVKAGSIAAVVIAVALAAMYWWVFIRPALPAAIAHKAAQAAPAPKPHLGAPEAVASTPPVALPETAPAVASTPAQELPSPQPAAPKAASAKSAAPAKSAPAAKATPPATAPAAETTPESATASTQPVTVVSGEGSGKLRFRFHGNSWVEIRDGRGKVILSKLNVAGSEAEVTGQPPFNVIVGNAPEVELSYNDHEVDLESHTKVAVARLTVE